MYKYKNNFLYGITHMPLPLKHEKIVKRKQKVFSLKQANFEELI